MPYQIFLSSCFDYEMQQNREIFRADLIARFNERSGQYGDNTFITDFEYGIPDGLKAEQIIDICASSVKEADLFICILGRRYGFLIDKKRVPPVYIHIRDWLMPEASEDKEISFFEIEILAALLYIPDKSCFLIWNTLEREDRADRLLKALIAKGYDIHYFDLRENLIELAVDRFVVYSGYFFPEELEEFSENVAPLLTNKRKPSSLTDSQIRYLSRKLRYSIPSEAIISKLSTYVDSFSTSTLVLLGDNDSGKSMAIAEWVRRNVERKDILLHCWFHEEGVNNLSMALMDLLKLEQSTGDFFYQDDAVYAFYDTAVKKHDVKQVFILDGIEHLKEAMETGWLITRTDPTVKVIITLNNEFSEYLKDGHVIVEKVFACPSLSLLEQIYEREGKGLEYPYIKETLKDICKNWSLRQVTEGIQQFLKIMKYQPKSINADGYTARICKYLGDFHTRCGIFSNTKRYLEINFDPDIVHESVSLIALTERGLTRKELSDLMHGRTEIFYQLYFVMDQIDDLFMLPCEVTEWQINSISQAETLKFRKKLICYFENVGNDRAHIEVFWQLVKLQDRNKIVSFLSSIRKWSLIHTNSSLYFTGIDQVLSKGDWNYLVDCWIAELNSNPDFYSEKEIYTISNGLDTLCRIEEAAEVMKIMLRRDVDAFSMASYHQQIASLYEDLGDDRAIDHIDQAVYYLESTEDKAFIQNKIDTYLAGAYTYAYFLKKKEYPEKQEKAIINKLQSWIQKVVRLTAETSYANPNYLVLSYHNIAYTYWNMEQYDLALDFIDRALSISRPDISLTVSDLKLRAQIYDDMYCAQNQYISDETDMITVGEDPNNEYLILAGKDLDEALRLQQKLAKKAGRMSYLAELAELHFVLSQNLGYRGYNKESIQEIDVALEIEKEANVAHDFYATYYQEAIARLGMYSKCREQHFLAEALEFLERAEEDIVQDETADASFYLEDIAKLKKSILKKVNG